MKIIPENKTHLVSESDVDLNLNAVQQGKWDYISENKGDIYLLSAFAYKFKMCNPDDFYRFLNDLFNDTKKDVEAGQRLQRARKINSDDIELDLEN